MRSLSLIRAVLGPLFLASCSLALANTVLPPEMASACQRLKPSAAYVKLTEAAVTYKQELGISDMTKENANKGVYILGITRSRYRVTVESKGERLEFPELASACTTVDILVHIERIAHEVQVAKEIPPESCGYQVVLAHENEHVKVNLEHFRNAARELEFAVGDIVQGKVFYGLEAASDIKRMIDSHIRPVVNSKVVVNNMLHRAIDDPAKVKEELRACNGELQQYLRREL